MLIRCCVVAVMVLAFASTAVAREDRDRGPREKANPIVKTVKKIVKVLGDGLTVPLP